MIATCEECRVRGEMTRQEQLDWHDLEAARLMGLPRKRPWKSMKASAEDDESFREPNDG